MNFIINNFCVKNKSRCSVSNIGRINSVFLVIDLLLKKASCS